MEITPEQLKEIIVEAISESQKDEKITFLIADAAKISGIGRDKITELVYKGEIPHFKVGNKTLIYKSSFLAWIDKITKEGRTL